MPLSLLHWLTPREQRPTWHPCWVSKGRSRFQTARQGQLPSPGNRVRRRRPFPRFPACQTSTTW